jgi:hypothetical protein
MALWDKSFVSAIRPTGENTERSRRQTGRWKRRVKLAR